MKIWALLLTVFCTFSAFAEDCAHCATTTPPPFPEIPEWPIEYVKIRKINYERHPKASFCTRPIEMIDTIVLHHSETTSTTTPERINEMHMDRNPKDPWLMVGYSYLISSPYAGNTTPKPEVVEGRPLDIVGAHAGSNLFVPMNELQKKLWDDKKVVCGFEGQDFSVDSSKVDGKGGISPNITTIGLVVMGNYSPYSKSNPNGYRAGAVRNPTKATQDTIARTACQLQKKYPLMKSIKWHNYYHSTSCPGRIKNYISQIIAQAKVYGCDFN